MELTTVIIHCQNGDPEAFEELYDLYCEKALKTAYLIAGEKGIAEDIIQETFIRCFKNIKKLRNPGIFNSWFYRILVRCGWRITAKYRTHNRAEIVMEEQTNERERIYCIEESIEAQEACCTVQQAVKRLSLPLKTVVILYYYDNMKIQEISTILNCFQGTVKSRLHNARKLLAKELRPYFMDGGDFNQTCQQKELQSNG